MTTPVPDDATRTALDALEVLDGPEQALGEDPLASIVLGHVGAQVAFASPLPAQPPLGILMQFQVLAVLDVCAIGLSTRLEELTNKGEKLSGWRSCSRRGNRTGWPGSRSTGDRTGAGTSGLGHHLTLCGRLARELLTSSILRLRLGVSTTVGCTSGVGWNNSVGWNSLNGVHWASSGGWNNSVDWKNSIGWKSLNSVNWASSGGCNTRRVCVFDAVPHGTSVAWCACIVWGTRIVGLGADARISSVGWAGSIGGVSSVIRHAGMCHYRSSSSRARRGTHCVSLTLANVIGIRRAVRDPLGLAIGWGPIWIPPWRRHRGRA